jgi:hypothetical protein
MSDSIRDFLTWASTDGHIELVDAIHSSERYANFDRSVAVSVLDDHLNTVRELGIVIGATRIRTLVEEYAPHCPSTPAVLVEELAKLEERYSPTAHR